MKRCLSFSGRWAILMLAGAGFAVWPAASVYAQTRTVLIERADSLSGTEQAGEAIRRLIGNVRLRQDEAILEADEATEYASRNEILFFGNVRIVNTPDTLTAERVRYDTQTRIGEANGNVRLSDGDVVLSAPTGTYDRARRFAVFDAGVTLIDSTSTLTSLRGRYDANTKVAQFDGNVRLEQENLWLAADSVTHFREVDVSDARGIVLLRRLTVPDTARTAVQVDTLEPIAVRPDTLQVGSALAAVPSLADSLGWTERTMLFGRRIRNDRKLGRTLVEGRPLLVRERVNGNRIDTLIVSAGRLTSLDTDSLSWVRAIDSVRVWQPDLAALADSAAYEQEAGAPELLSLFQRPVLWVQASQIVGDTIRVDVRDCKPQRLRVNGAAFLGREDSLLSRIQQMQGGQMIGEFDADTLRNLALFPNAEAIYFRTEDEELAGAVRLTADRLDFRFAGGELDRMTGKRGIEGRYFAAEAIPSPFQLPRFTWTPERRPGLPQLLLGLDPWYGLIQEAGRRSPARAGPSLSLRGF
ncbi:MAG: OstA-like protein [Bacteroidota bacterium]